MVEELEATLRKAVHRQVEAEYELGRDLGNYVGKWVAVKDHEVVAAADTLDELLAIIDRDDVEAVFEVTEKVGTACFF